MQPEARPIKTLLLQVFLPAVLLVAALLATFAYNWHYSTILEGFDRKLITTSSLTGAMITPDDHDVLIEAARNGDDASIVEQTAVYRRNADPISRILTELNLTYLYSQATAETSDIVYVLDGSVGDEHSPIGTEDDLSDQTMAGIVKVEAEGGVFVSPIEYQEQWGLLKTAAAPIYDGEGGISSTAGADVNISLILVATQNALFASTLIGLGSIGLCLLITFAFVRMVARPIEALKDEALGFAAGGAVSKAEVRGPKEVTKLSKALSNMANAIASASADNEHAFEDRKDQASLAMLTATNGSMHAGKLKLLSQGAKNVFWLPTGRTQRERVLDQHAMANLAARFADHAELLDDWRLLADTKNGVCLSFDQGNRTVEVVGEYPVKFTRDGQIQLLKPGVPEPFNSSANTLAIGEGAPFQISDAFLPNRGEA